MDPNDAPDAIVRCIANLAEEKGVTYKEILANTSTILIGTTLATNCILEEQGRQVLPDPHQGLPQRLEHWANDSPRPTFTI